MHWHLECHSLDIFHQRTLCCSSSPLNASCDQLRIGVGVGRHRDLYSRRIPHFGLAAQKNLPVASKCELIFHQNCGACQPVSVCPSGFWHCACKTRKPSCRPFDILPSVGVGTGHAPAFLFSIANNLEDKLTINAHV